MLFSSGKVSVAYIHEKAMIVSCQGCTSHKLYRGPKQASGRVEEVCLSRSFM